MKGDGQIAVARRPERRASGIGSGLQISAQSMERLPKSLKKFAASPIGKEISKIKDEPVMYMKIKDLISDKLPNPTMFMIIKEFYCFRRI
jgi:hypothetical protein